MSAGLDEKGELVGLHVRISGQSINAWVNPTGIVNGRDMRQLQGYAVEPGDAQLGYAVPNMTIEYVMRNTHVPVGPWRGVNTNQNGIYMECFIEECARAAGKDSLEFRRGLMDKFPKHLAVLNAVAEKGDCLAAEPEFRQQRGDAVLDRDRRVGRGRGQFEMRCLPARRVDCDEVGKRAADIDPDTDPHRQFVIPAQAGIHLCVASASEPWIPAPAGMTAKPWPVRANIISAPRLRRAAKRG